jgi:N-acylneuraminate cytidylyltransferase
LSDKNPSIAIITARGGSKRIPGKNTRVFIDRPIIAYSIKAAIDCGRFDAVMVSTDDLEIAEISKRFGAEVPFLRSAETSNDYATTEDVIWEVVNNYMNKGESFTHICCIYPTAPFVSVEKLIGAMDLLKKSDADSVIPVVKFSYPPQRAIVITNGKLIMKYPEFICSRSQDLETWYHDCGQFYCIKIKPFLETRSFLTENTIPFIVPESEVQDIDTEEDWALAEMKYIRMVEERL